MFILYDLCHVDPVVDVIAKEGVPPQIWRTGAFPPKLAAALRPDKHSNSNSDTTQSWGQMAALRSLRAISSEQRPATRSGRSSRRPPHFALACTVTLCRHARRAWSTFSIGITEETTPQGRSTPVPLCLRATSLAGWSWSLGFNRQKQCTTLLSTGL